jgi:hypothetical protein
VKIQGLVALTAASILLVGCASYEQTVADDCTQLGYTPGTAGFAGCVQQDYAYRNYYGYAPYYGGPYAPYAYGYGDGTYQYDYDPWGYGWGWFGGGAFIVGRDHGHDRRHFFEHRFGEGHGHFDGEHALHGEGFHGGGFHGDGGHRG